MHIYQVNEFSRTAIKTRKLRNRGIALAVVALIGVLVQVAL